MPSRDVVTALDVAKGVVAVFASIKLVGLFSPGRSEWCGKQLELLSLRLYQLHKREREAKEAEAAAAAAMLTANEKAA